MVKVRRTFSTVKGLTVDLFVSKGEIARRVGVSCVERVEYSSLEILLSVDFQIPKFGRHFTIFFSSLRTTVF